MVFFSSFKSIFLSKSRLNQGRLEQEKSLTKNLSMAASKLQVILKQTQEQLGKEREKVKALKVTRVVGTFMAFFNFAFCDTRGVGWPELFDC